MEFLWFLLNLSGNWVLRTCEDQKVSHWKLNKKTQFSSKCTIITKRRYQSSVIMSKKWILNFYFGDKHIFVWKRNHPKKTESLRLGSVAEISKFCGLSLIQPRVSTGSWTSQGSVTGPARVWRLWQLFWKTLHAQITWCLFGLPQIASTVPKNCLPVNVIFKRHGWMRLRG